MSGLFVEMLSSIVSQLAGQGLTLQHGNNNNSSNIGHSGLSIASTIPIVNENEFSLAKTNLQWNNFYPNGNEMERPHRHSRHSR